MQKSNKGQSMAEGALTVITVTDQLDALRGVPPAGTGMFTIGDPYITRFQELAILRRDPGSGIENPVLQMRYEATSARGVAWSKADMSRGSRSADETWLVDGRDDLGTEYEVQGGASGFYGPHDEIFDSEIDFEPSVPSDVSWVEIRFMDANRPNEPVHIFRAHVPAGAIEAAEPWT